MEEKESKVISLENGLELVKGKGGKRPGAGRKTREQSLTNYTRAVKMLDDSVEYALDTMIQGLTHVDPAVRFKCAEFLINKSLINKKMENPDLSSKISKEDMESAVDQVMAMIACNK